MFITEVTGGQIRRARELLGLSPGQLATHSGIIRITLRLYESYGDEAPSAQTHVLARLLHYLRDAGIEFRDDGTVHLARAMPISRTTVHLFQAVLLPRPILWLLPLHRRTLRFTATLNKEPATPTSRSPALVPQRPGRQYQDASKTSVYVEASIRPLPQSPAEARS
jgi:hypothetical protein